MKYLPSWLFISIIISCGVGCVHSLRWCCKSINELRKCRHLRQASDEAGTPYFDFDCVIKDGVEGCMRALKNGVADVIDIDGGDVFRYKNDIVLAAAENRGVDDASYFAVAVVHKGADDNLSLHNLIGYKSCHTSIGKTAGWNMPMGWLARMNYNRAPFSQSCAPGANNPEFLELVPDNNPTKWCALCIGDEHGDHVCDRDSDERYYGYHGAFQCLKDGKGDVAFVKHSIPIEPGVDQSKFQLLCRNETRPRAPPADWRNCNIGRVPSHAVVMDVARATEENARNVAEILNRAKAAFEFDFNSYGGKNLLWSSSTVSFLPRILMSPREFMGEDYYCNTHALHTNQVADGC
ncbi:serotransferrin-like [Clavelina lepadiformis]|uniref:serotransferrin-like n=1 Tax=Clavelina lepadiformis TaxID=159417 RepID=UPI004041EA70